MRLILDLKLPATNPSKAIGRGFCFDQLLRLNFTHYQLLRVNKDEAWLPADRPFGGPPYPAKQLVGFADQYNRS